ncbi:tetratricopeptide repeat protein [Amycolatopsis jiangsuensis]|uniref:Tetratricopeptide repeat protein n=1 Tax=Amycolatopsis jiangsuensis TaxID=1181879 RepID=A0A840IT55_9PSEU|nr:hypothetical protein [Amycolatopsis jiangsuensis]MBB4685060.1 hypothetical protein [Amycolatopsis jiangsuensis]
MYSPPDTDERPAARPRDRVAAAVGNASLLGIGYLLLGRRLLAAVTIVVTVVLVVLLTTVAPFRWFEVLILAWWAFVVAHGWYLARENAAKVGKQRMIALSVTAVVFAAVGLLRFDAVRIDGVIADARAQGSCATATEALDSRWLGHRVADAPLVTGEEATREACRRLRAANGKLARALSGKPGATAAAFGEFASVRREMPGHEAMAAVVLGGFLRHLPTPDACTTAKIDDWLSAHASAGPAPAQSAATVARTAPAAYLGCGDRLMTAKDWTTARTWYQRIVDRYPTDPRVAKAKEGITKATQALELAKVRELLDGPTGIEPDYCDSPAPYSAAAPYGAGTNRALFYGNDGYSGRFPAEWRASDAAQAVLVVCLGDDEDGTPVQTCPYENKMVPEFPIEVTFHKVAVPLKAYELRTGKLVVDTKVEIGGASCPRKLHYRSYVADLGPPSDTGVEPSDADVRAAFAPIIRK